MRILVDVEDAKLRSLGYIANENDRSRAAVIREAIAGYLASHGPAPAGTAFALWGTGGEDGLAVQHRLRDEW